MAHTSNGNLTGRAASTHKRETAEYLRSREESIKEIIDRLQKKQDAAVLRCIAMEGAESFWAWYDEDKNVPPNGTYSDRIQRIERRIESLEAERRYTIVDNMLGGEEANILRIADVAELIRMEGK